MADKTSEKKAAAKVLAVQNIKGGVGKTTLAVNLAALMAIQHGKRVLLIDCDAQCNASTYLLEDSDFKACSERRPKKSRGTLYDLFVRGDTTLNLTTGQPTAPHSSASNYVHNIFKGPGKESWCLDLVPCSPDMFEIQEYPAEFVAKRLSRWLSQKKQGYDLVILDCPPSINPVSLAALRCAPSVLVPMKADVFSIRGLPILQESLDRYRDILGIKAKIAGVLFTMFPPEDQQTQRIVATGYKQDIEALCQKEKRPIPVLKPTISFSSAYPESFESRQPIPRTPSHKDLIAELEAVAQELGLAA